MSDRFVTRAYNSILPVYPCGGLVKRSATPRLMDEIEYYQKIHNTSLGIYFPRLIGYTTFNDEKLLYIEQYNYPNPSLNTVDTKFFRQLCDILDEFSRCQSGPAGPVQLYQPDAISSCAGQMYIDKTLREFDNLLREFPELHKLTTATTVICNGKEYLGFDELRYKVIQYVNKYLLKHDTCVIHGDLCFSNILWDNDIIRFVDPRGSFGDHKGIFGDPRYDIAKLYHSVDGLYEHIIYDQFNVSCDENNQWTLDFINPPSWEKIQEFDDIFFGKYDARDIMVIEGLIFIGMCARHYDSIERQKAMYLTGLRILNEVFTT
jgi:hypothetical protein